MSEKLKEHIDLQDDLNLIEKVRKDIKAFRPLYEKYYERVFRFIFRRTLDEELTADICSQTFYKALSSIKKYEHREKPFIAWLYTIAGNEIKKHYRKKKPIFTIELDGLSHEIPIINEWPNSYKKRLEDALSLLNEEELKYIELKYMENYTFKEIALILDKGESSVKMKIYRLLEKIKDSINDPE